MRAFERVGSGAGELHLPAVVAGDGAGNVVVADTCNHRIVRSGGGGAGLWAGGKRSGRAGQRSGRAAVPARLGGGPGGERHRRGLRKSPHRHLLRGRGVLRAFGRGAVAGNLQYPCGGVHGGGYAARGGGGAVLWVGGQRRGRAAVPAWRTGRLLPVPGAHSDWLTDPTRPGRGHGYMASTLVQQGPGCEAGDCLSTLHPYPDAGCANLPTPNLIGYPSQSVSGRPGLPNTRHTPSREKYTSLTTSTPLSRGGGARERGDHRIPRMILSRHFGAVEIATGSAGERDLYCKDSIKGASPHSEVHGL
jgi:hypothetical protein